MKRIEILPGDYVVSINGEDCQTKSELLKEIAEKLSFPKFFGANWSALEDLLNDLGWLSSYSRVVMVVNSSRLCLSKEHGQMSVFKDILALAEENNSNEVKFAFLLL